MFAQIEKIQSLTSDRGIFFSCLVMEFLNRLQDLVFADLEKMMGHKFHNSFLWVSTSFLKDIFV